MRLGPGGDYRRDIWRLDALNAWDYYLAAALLLALSVVGLASC